MSLLNICQSAAEEIGIDIPVTIIGNTDNVNAQKLLRYATKVGNRLMKISVWQELRIQRTFTSLNAMRQDGILPSDFDRMVPESFWDRTNAFQLALAGTVEWQTMLSSRVRPQRKFIYRQGAIEIYPVPTGGQLLAFEYVSKNWVEPVSGDPTNTFTADTDDTFFDEELMIAGSVMAYTLDQGLNQGTSTQELDNYLSTMIDNDQPKSSIMAVADIFSGGRHSTGEPGNEGGIISDTSKGQTWGNSDQIWGE